MRFSSKILLAEKIKRIIETALAERFGLSVPVYIITAEDLQDILNRAPDWWGNDNKEQYDNLIFILTAESPEKIADEIGGTTDGLEQIQIDRKSIFWSFKRKSYPKCRWWKKTAESGIAEKLTIRTANTLRKICQ